MFTNLADGSRTPCSVLVYADTYPPNRKKAETGTVLCCEKNLSQKVGGFANMMKCPKTIITHNTKRIESKAVMRIFLTGFASAAAAAAAPDVVALAAPPRVSMLLLLLLLLLCCKTDVAVVVDMTVEGVAIRVFAPKRRDGVVDGGGDAANAETRRISDRRKQVVEIKAETRMSLGRKIMRNREDAPKALFGMLFIYEDNATRENEKWFCLTHNSQPVWWCVWGLGLVDQKDTLRVLRKRSGSEIRIVMYFVPY